MERGEGGKNQDTKGEGERERENGEICIRILGEAQGEREERKRDIRRERKRERGDRIEREIAS